MHNEWEWIRQDWCFLSNKTTPFRYFVILLGLRCVLNKTIASENNSFTSENEYCCGLTGDVFSYVFTSSVLVTDSYRWICVTAALPQHSAVCSVLCLITLAIYEWYCLYASVPVTRVTLGHNWVTTKWHVCKTNSWIWWYEVFVLCLESFGFLCISCVGQSSRWWQFGGQMCVASFEFGFRRLTPLLLLPG